MTYNPYASKIPILDLFIMSITALSILQVVLVVILVILVLLQPPGGGSLSGFSNSQQGTNSMLPVKSSENPLVGITSMVAGLFIINTLLLSGLSSKDVHKKSIAGKIILEKKQEGHSTSVPFEN